VFKTIDINIVGVLYTVKLALHYFRLPADETPLPGRKLIIFVGSMGGYTEMPFATLYNSSKFAVRGMFKSLRNAVPMAHMRINLIAPK
jgi:NAD(P)-dependent dehydrogenase (short-subunit alcohol dehydrogenase family)